MKKRNFPTKTENGNFAGTRSGLLIHQATNKQVLSFSCLQGRDVIAAQISDHHPLIQGQVLFWNVMMQGRVRKRTSGDSFNNGFGIMETDSAYKKRLIQIAHVIAEIVLHCPTIETIGLCEGPIDPEHVKIFSSALQKFQWMKCFFHRNKSMNNFHSPAVEGCPNWGLLMLTDTKYSVEKIDCPMVKNAGSAERLVNRFQIWEIKYKHKTKYFGLAHFPFGGDELSTDKENLSQSGQNYCQMVNNLLLNYSDKEFIFCADFNFNPYLISRWQDRKLDNIAHHNSILLVTKEKPNKFFIKTATVDGILLSLREKQKEFARQGGAKFLVEYTLNHGLFRTKIHPHLIEQRHHSAAKQKEYDKVFGIIKYNA